jgi:hypothetical protein
LPDPEIIMQKGGFTQQGSHPKNSKHILLCKVWVSSDNKLTWIISIMIAKITFATSVKKLTLIGLNWNFPSTFDIKTKIGCKIEYTISKVMTARQSDLYTICYMTEQIKDGPIAKELCTFQTWLQKGKS